MLWLALSGIYKPLLIALGIASAILVVYLSARMRVVGTGAHRPSLYLRLPIYALWLFGQIILANGAVAYRIVHPRLPIQPQYLRIKLAGDTPLFHLIHANSITLTPGTISAHIEDGFIQIHALSDANIRELLSERMANKVLWLEGRAAWLK